MITHVYDFSEAKAKPIWDKTFKKYLQIQLADGTRVLKTNDGSVHSAQIAYKKSNNNSPVGSGQLKKYKVRITSKKTGRKIDINIEFANNVYTNYLNKEIDVEPLTLGEDVLLKEMEKMEGKLPAVDKEPFGC